MARALELTWPQVAAWRLHQQHLDKRAPAGSLLAVVSRLCGLHAQVLSSAELTAWARVEGLERGAVQRALWQERTLVKTWAMRGTLHLLPAGELSLWHAGLRTNPRYLRSAAWQRYFGVTLEQLDALTNAIATVLHGRIMTREELVGELAQNTGLTALSTKVAESSWGTILKPAAFAGGLCFGPSIAQRVRFTHPETWLSTMQPAVDAETATAAIARRFLAAYGPATYRDVARWWGGGGIATSRQWISALGDEVRPVSVDGSSAWMLAAHARKICELPPSRSVRLLPAFDQYVIGASCHSQNLLPGDLRARVYRGQGWISPVLLVDGRMLGVWRHEVKASSVEVTIEPFVPVPARVRRAAGQEAERLAAFFGSKPKVVWRSQT